MSDKEKIIDQISAKYSKNQLRKLSASHIKLTAGMSKHEILAKIEKLSKNELENILKGETKTSAKKEAKGEKVIELSIKPNKWMIPAIAVIAVIILLSSGVLTNKGTSNTSTTTSTAVLTYIVDNACPTCYDVTINEEILTQQYGLTLTVNTYDINSQDGIALINKYKITKVPAFIVAGESVNSNTQLLNVWSSVGTVETDGALVFRSPEVISNDYKVLSNGEFIMYIPPEQTLGTFLVMKNDTCVENGKPIVYFFGSTTCPHCLWEHPIINNVSLLFNNTISYHDNMASQNDMTVFDNYMEFNRGGVPFIVIGCKYIRVGSGEAAISENETISELNKTVPEVIKNSLALYNIALDYRTQAINAYNNNQSNYEALGNNYTLYLQKASEEIEKQVLIKLICNVTNNMPASICQ